MGSRGDIQPYVALALGLVEAGHDVRITTHRIFEGFVKEHGLDFFPLDIDPRQVLVNRAVAELGNNTFRITRWMQENFRPALQDVFQVTLDSAQDADLLLNSALSFAGWHVAQKLKAPAIAVYLQPATPTRTFPAATITLPPSWLPFKGIYNYAASKVANQFFFRMLLSMNNDCREEVLDLPPLSATYYWKIDSPSAGVPMIYGYSPTVLPRPSNWGDSIKVVGYWFLESAEDYHPPAELEEFLASGPKPVYIGFGSMVDHEREQMTRLVVEALDQAGQRAILLGGWSELGSQVFSEAATNAFVLPDTILNVDYVPHDWLFPRVAAVVHHGGAGTTAAGLRAGAPTVVVAFFGDQPFWGKRIAELGVGPEPVARKKLTADRLAQAILKAISDNTIQQRAAELGAKIRAEDGITRAVELIEKAKY